MSNGPGEQSCPRDGAESSVYGAAALAPGCRLEAVFPMRAEGER
jgi:hypothetical protein